MQTIVRTVSKEVRKSEDEEKNNFFITENNIKKETVVERKFRNIVGDYKEDKKGLLGKCINKKGFNSSPGHTSKETAFHIPPNRYDVSKKPFSCKKGANGAYISKIGRTPLQESTGSMPNEYSPVVSVKDRLHNYSNHFKGVFLRSG